MLIDLNLHVNEIATEALKALSFLQNSLREICADLCFCGEKMSFQELFVKES